MSTKFHPSPVAVLREAVWTPDQISSCAEARTSTGALLQTSAGTERVSLGLNFVR